MLNNDQNVQASVATKDDSSNGARYIKTNCYKTNRNLHTFQLLSPHTGRL
jgi:hypothetical protein